MIMDMNWYLRWGKAYSFRSISVTRATTNSLAYHPYQMDRSTEPYPPPARRRFPCAVCPWMAFTLHPAPILASASDAVALVLEGLLESDMGMHTMAPSSSFVILVVFVATNLAGPYLRHGILMVRVMASASGRHCCVSWHSRPASCATIMSPPPPS